MNTGQDSDISESTLLDWDSKYIWHPYSGIQSDIPAYPIRSAQGASIRLYDGRELIDGMSSWWSAIHGYNHPVLNQAVMHQVNDMAHIMFGGLTHAPAVSLAKLLVDITPSPLQRVFFSDSGSVAVEVAIKMAIQYWLARKQPDKNQLLALRGGYHGDTFATMAVCDPVNGMHHLFNRVLRKHLFAERPSPRFGEACNSDDIADFKSLISTNHQQLAAVILEPIVQGAGGMHFYSADYLYQVRELCNEFDVLLIADEIATGFGRTGKLFACEHAAIAPDILCLGKSLTGGYMSLAATLCTEAISAAISAGEGGAFMHGPTFMANPLATATALASVKLLLSQPWQKEVQRVESGLQAGLEPAHSIPGVAGVRVLGGIGVIEMHEPVVMQRLQPALVDQGVWIRPFGRLVYTIPPLVISDQQLATLCTGILRAISDN